VCSFGQRSKVLHLSTTARDLEGTLPRNVTPEVLKYNCTENDMCVAVGIFVYTYYGTERQFIQFLCYSVQRDLNLSSKENVQDYITYLKKSKGSFNSVRLLKIVEDCYHDANVPQRTLTHDGQFPTKVRHDIFMTFYMLFEKFEKNYNECMGHQNNEQSTIISSDQGFLPMLSRNVAEDPMENNDQGKPGYLKKRNMCDWSMDVCTFELFFFLKSMFDNILTSNLVENLT
jgi:hypothetical protein